ncbi:MAG: hypothetical protein ACI9Y8_000716 [Candidatus Omnitrophota bacterium]|jgi:hypothetical protein
MLRFAEPPDRIFTEILNRTLEKAKDFLQDANNPLLNKEERNALYERICSRSNKVFTPKLALRTIKDIKKYHEDSNLWNLNGYHLFLLHDALNAWIEDYNTLDCEEPIKYYSKDITEIDFDCLLSRFFEDTDFLINQEVMTDITEEIKDQMCYDQETFGIAMGLKPHEDELEIKLHSKGSFKPKKASIRGYFSTKRRVKPEF